MKIKLTYSYDGSKFNGSQTQPNLSGVEDRLKIALARIGIITPLLSSSRTDKGVHALNQVSSVECGEYFADLNSLKNILNRHTMPYIFIKKIDFVSLNFHPRYDAKFRSYRYIINHGEFSPFLANYETFLPKIDVKKANEILNLFVGTHDFVAFMKLGSDSKNTIRTITKAFCYSHKNKTIIVFKADGFLRSQIRLIVASLLKALTIENGDKLIYEALNLKSKENSKYDIKNGINLPQNKISKMTEKLANTTPLTRIPAPPNGLYLNRIFY